MTHEIPDQPFQDPFDENDLSDTASQQEFPDSSGDFSDVDATNDMLNHDNTGADDIPTQKLAMEEQRFPGATELHPVTEENYIAVDYLLGAIDRLFDSAPAVHDNGDGLNFVNTGEMLEVTGDADTAESAVMIMDRLPDWAAGEGYTITDDEGTTEVRYDSGGEGAEAWSKFRNTAEAIKNGQVAGTYRTTRMKSLESEAPAQPASPEQAAFDAAFSHIEKHIDDTLTAMGPPPGWELDEEAEKYGAVAGISEAVLAVERTYVSEGNGTAPVVTTDVNYVRSYLGGNGMFVQNYRVVTDPTTGEVQTGTRLQSEEWAPVQAVDSDTVLNVSAPVENPLPEFTAQELQQRSDPETPFNEPLTPDRVRRLLIRPLPKKDLIQ